VKWRLFVKVVDALTSAYFRNRIDISRTETLVKLATENGVGPDAANATHSMHRTKATLIYRKTGNLRAVQLLLGHSKIDSAVLYLGVEVEDALSLAESIEL